MPERQPFPLYYQVANKMGILILSGGWPPRTKLPTEEELCTRYGVSRLTVRRAKGELHRYGLIQSTQGSGSYVTDPKGWKTDSAKFIETLDDLFEFGQQLTFDLLEFRMAPNSKAVSQKLGNEGDRFVFQIRGVRSSNGQPLSYAVYHIPFGIGSRISAEALDKTPYIPQFEKMLGITVAEGLYSFSSGRANRRVAGHLGVKPGSPVLVVEAIYLDSAQRPIELIETQYRQEYCYRLRMRRMKPGVSEGADPHSFRQGLRAV